VIKTVLGFRRFLLRGMKKVSGEWNVVCLAYNLKRLHRLGAGLKLATASLKSRLATSQPQTGPAELRGGSSENVQRNPAAYFRSW
jgi:hypothetical protein